MPRRKLLNLSGNQTLASVSSGNFAVTASPQPGRTEAGADTKPPSLPSWKLRPPILPESAVDGREGGGGRMSTWLAAASLSSLAQTGPPLEGTHSQHPRISLCLFTGDSRKIPGAGNSQPPGCEFAARPTPSIT